MNLPKQNLAVALDRANDLLCDIGAIKGRDPREPGRLRKQRAESRLAAVVMRHFRTQKAQLRHALEVLPPKPALKATQPYDYEQFMADESFGPNVYRLLLEFAKDGVSLFDETASTRLDYTLTNIEVAKWARKYAYDLVKGIDATTVDALQEAVSAFSETPGYTIGDIVKQIEGDAFSLDRSTLVATTEVTRAYAKGNIAAGKQMQAEFPGVLVVKKWHTNRDDRVCDICAPLDNTELSLDEMFGGNYDDPPGHPGCRCWITVRTRINARGADAGD